MEIRMIKNMSSFILFHIPSILCSTAPEEKESPTTSTINPQNVVNAVQKLINEQSDSIQDKFQEQMQFIRNQLESLRTEFEKNIASSSSAPTDDPTNSQIPESSQNDTFLFPGTEDDYKNLDELFKSYNKCYHPTACTCSNGGLCVIKVYESLSHILSNYPEWKAPNIYEILKRKPRMNKILFAVLKNITRHKNNQSKMYRFWSLNPKLRHLIDERVLDHVASVNKDIGVTAQLLSASLKNKIANKDERDLLAKELMKKSKDGKGIAELLLPFMLLNNNNTVNSDPFTTLFGSSSGNSNCGGIPQMNCSRLAGKCNLNQAARSVPCSGSSSNGGIDPLMLLAMQGDSDISNILLMQQLQNNGNTNGNNLSFNPLLLKLLNKDKSDSGDSLANLLLMQQMQGPNSSGFNPLMLKLLSKDKGDSSDQLTNLLLMQQMQGSNTGGINPLMIKLLTKDKGDSGDSLTNLLLIQQLQNNGSDSPLSNTNGINPLLLNLLSKDTSNDSQDPIQLMMLMSMLDKKPNTDSILGSNSSKNGISLEMLGLLDPSLMETVALLQLMNKNGDNIFGSNPLSQDQPARRSSSKNDTTSSYGRAANVVNDVQDEVVNETVEEQPNPDTAAEYSYGKGYGRL
ncbi:hypothetical protein EDEG_01468 [Edhazardia aedis USNM 41457]|uniref:Uncharacterized protein n=1 Tax=Edhazardia aedis (strain USNM 41457) TaxID=1003232 RepID=J9D9S0_EDHAE|nr:hypothetical protein EDEG_01468 [Edhazardia aedis USNM 41457]|eukprot:EJW04254.1 hypothetical protein EDEG_01468 [Edhazardia aedis USNM 41457]